VYRKNLMSRIFYFCHDNPAPSGGILTLYNHVEIIKDAGFDAMIVHFNEGFKLNWFNSSAPVTYVRKIKIYPDDWVVIPEDYITVFDILSTIPCNKVLFCQGHYNIFNYLPEQKRYEDYGVSDFLVSSKEVQRFIEDVFKVPTTLIPYAVDKQIFKPSDEKRKLLLAYMPRRGAWNINQIKGILYHRAPELRDIQWVPIDNLSLEEVASVLQNCFVFLSTGYREGFGLPPVEGMACGCIIVGFPAGGGREYAKKENGFWVTDEDPLLLADVLENVLKLIKHDPNNRLITSKRESGYQTANYYSIGRQKDILINYWQQKFFNFIE